MTNDLDKERNIEKLADAIDENMRLQRDIHLALNIVDDMLYGLNGSFDTVSNLLSMLVSQDPKNDDMITAMLRKRYNDVVLRMVEENYDPLDFENLVEY